MPPINPTSLTSIRDLSSLLAFLRNPDPLSGLGWMIRDDVDAEELFYDYSEGNFAKVGEGIKLRQLINMTGDQPWGVFLVETPSEKLYTTELRRVLRVLAPKARSQSSYLPVWPSENLLFIVTRDYQQFTFAHFEGSESAKAKLKTFGWNQTEVGVRTLCEHNLPALRWIQNPEDGMTWLSQWSAAFDVEKVTDRFFKDFRDLFESRKEALARKIKNEAERHAFVQRLLNRLLFLSFLQKKRWLKAPNTPHPQATYLFDLFDSAEAQGEIFYDDYLYDLFFNALNRPHKTEAADRKRVEQRLGIVPFLNGGLFDHVDDWDEAGQIKLDNDFFQPILGRDGLLRRYNFTVTESTPLNQEAAVDPEMLGKVFETVVLTSEGAENYQAPNLRKATGSFYTPRIVVTLIVREALKSDLMAHVAGLNKENLTRLMEWDAQSGLGVDDRAALRELVADSQADGIISRLEELRACDPAIGSGAFALGLLHELLNLRLLCENITRGKNPLREKLNVAFDIKKQIIEHNIYGVDLQAKAVEICKLRLWLSLVVDYELSVDPDTCTAAEFAKAIEKIPALPNLGFKIRRGDALLDLVQGKVFQFKEISHNAEMQDAVANLQNAHQRFFSAEEPDAKRGLRLQALTERTRLSRLQIESQLKALENRNATQEDMFAVKETKASVQAAQEERERLEAALGGIRETEKELKKLGSRRASDKDDAALNRLEALRESEEITFAWELDFPEIFFESNEPASTLTGKMNLVNATKGQMELATPVNKRGGFDLMVGNPPFVTARNKEKNELYRERWKETCHLKYQLVAPFFQRSFTLLRANAFLGFIVSNAFAKREFGKPLVEDFFPTIELQKIIDCSGLMFPGHGTPTYILFGNNRKPNAKNQIRIVATVSGGGDLRTMPENSTLWATIQENHDKQNYTDNHISVTDRTLSEVKKWPWNLDVEGEATKQVLEKSSDSNLREYLAEDIGFMFVMGRNDIFMHSSNVVRRFEFKPKYLKRLNVGEEVRDWEFLGEDYALFPYDQKTIELVSFPKKSAELSFFELFENELSERPTFNGTFAESGRLIYQYHQIPVERAKNPNSIAFPQVSTHCHFVYDKSSGAFNEKTPLIKLPKDSSEDDYHLFSGLLNSSAALLWFKSVCFSKREAEDAEAATYYEFSSSKIELLPIPKSFVKDKHIRKILAALSRACWERGQTLPALTYKKLFERKGEAYHGWYSSLSGYVQPSQTSEVSKTSEVSGDWHDSESLLAQYAKVQSERERLRGEMIALQEEMDWMVYEAYGLWGKDELGRMKDEEYLRINENGSIHPSSLILHPLHLGERPFELLRNGKAIPEHFSAERKELWKRRMEIIQSNEHIRRIEQPVYKRRWYRKVSDEREMQNAYEWFVLEKAEYWLEKVHKKHAVEIGAWAKSLWEDDRVRAGAQAIHHVEHVDDFVKLFKSIIKESAVPAWIPSAMAWEQVEKKFKDKKVPAIAKKIRGKLNVPRERFRVQEDGQYTWAGEE